MIQFELLFKFFLFAQVTHKIKLTVRINGQLVSSFHAFASYFALIFLENVATIDFVNIFIFGVL